MKLIINDQNTQELYNILTIFTQCGRFVPGGIDVVVVVVAGCSVAGGVAVGAGRIIMHL